MKRLAGIAIALVVAAPSWAVIAGSQHDFSTTGGVAPFNNAADTCSTCHVAHKPLVNVPLWNHTNTSVSYNLYKDNTSPAYGAGNAAAYDNTTPGRSAKCLGCHDGTVTVDGTDYVSSATDGGAYWILCDNEQAGATPPQMVGRGQGAPFDAATADGLKGSHPVMVDYAVVDNDATNYTAAASLTDAVLDDVGGGVLLVSCTTCHDAHAPNANMLRVAAAGTLCSDCHKK